MRLLKEIAATVAAAVALAAIFALHVPAARAELSERVGFNCEFLANLIQRAATYRDAGADVEKTVNGFIAHTEPPTPLHAVAMAREIRRMWREGLSEDDAAIAVFRRCHAQRGDMGREL